VSQLASTSTTLNQILDPHVGFRVWGLGG
jgi:hypothetical protein